MLGVGSGLGSGDPSGLGSGDPSGLGSTVAGGEVATGRLGSDTEPVSCSNALWTLEIVELTG